MVPSLSVAKLEKLEMLSHLPRLDLAVSFCPRSLYRVESRFPESEGGKCNAVARFLRSFSGPKYLGDLDRVNMYCSGNLHRQQIDPCTELEFHPSADKQYTQFLQLAK